MGCVGWHGSRRAGICPCSTDRRHGRAFACPCHPSNHVCRNTKQGRVSVLRHFRGRHLGCRRKSDKAEYRAQRAALSDHCTRSIVIAVWSEILLWVPECFLGSDGRFVLLGRPAFRSRRPVGLDFQVFSVIDGPLCLVDTQCARDDGDARMMKNSKNGPRRAVRYMTFLASGAWLFQTSGCIIDEQTTNQLINLVAQTLLTSLTGGTI